MSKNGTNVGKKIKDYISKNDTGRVWGLTLHLVGEAPVSLGPLN